MTDNSVDQSGASAGNKLIGRDDNSVTVYSGGNQHVRELVKKLEVEIASERLKNELIDSLQFFEEPFAPDGVLGLEKKLEKSGQASKLPLALRHKELFAKFLSKYALYGAAQELLALCLHQIHQEFEAKIHSRCDGMSPQQMDELIITDVVNCIVKEYGFGTFALNHGLVLGMTYWLADRCYVRWHLVQ
jgi:hypothetical protein